MKIQCNVCEATVATVLCCADEAALCSGCDQKVHAANKLAGKHQRVPLSSSSSQMPKCDICQETVGYFFCLEDRALLCRKCDLAIHSVNPLVSTHQRFLLTGVKVGTEAVEHAPPEKISEHTSRSTPKNAGNTTPAAAAVPAMAHFESRGDFLSSKLPTYEGGGSETISQWQLDEFLGLGDYNNQSLNFMD
ncbi:hypothetical protein M569_17102, partial [Genlisea aurea]